MIRQIIKDDQLLEVARLAVENVLVSRRDSRISVMRNNGLCIKERNSDPSSIIRMSIPECIQIGLEAIIKHLESEDECSNTRSNTGSG